MSIRNSIYRVLLPTCALLLTGSLLSADDNAWSSFQNAGTNASPAGGLPVKWAPDQNIAWQAEIEGYGQSTPIVIGDQIYVTSVSGSQKDQFHLAAFRLSSGEKLWQKEFKNPSPKENTPMTSRAAPSPIADAEGCIAFFEGGVIVSVSTSGEVRWERNLVDEYGAAPARHGLAASLEQDAERVFVWMERMKDPYILALDKKSGENVWKAEGVGSTSWASPRLVQTDDGSHLVCSASGKIVGVDPETGDRLWEFSEVANNTSCTPIPAGKNRFLIGASDGRGAGNEGAGAAYNGVVEIKKAADGYTASYLWNAQKASSSFGSPIVAGDTACFVNRAGVLYRLNLETGERVAVDRTSAGGIWATPIVSGDLLYLFGYKGTTSVISLKDGKEVAENQLWEAGAGGQSAFGGGKVLYAASPAPPYLIMRRGDTLYAVKETE
ncbi:MAG: PQQ-binding-like beta-propeller repeat protein [Planctomycetota bacterium]